MFKLFEFRDEYGNIIAEVPILIYNAKKTRELFDLMLPEMIEHTNSIVLKAFNVAIDTTRGKGAHQLPNGAGNYFGLVLSLDPTLPQGQVEKHENRRMEPDDDGPRPAAPPRPYVQGQNN